MRVTKYVFGLFLLLFLVACESSEDHLQPLTVVQENYTFDCALTTKINDTVVRYDTVSVMKSRYVEVCDKVFLNGTPDCHYESQKYRGSEQVPVIDGREYSFCLKESRQSIHLARGHFREDIVSLDGLTSCVKDGVLTTKDLSDGGTWGDARLCECWHPQIPCEQIDVRLNERVKGVALR